MHARAHVFYETGQHTEGLAWLDEWIRTSGAQANHRSHFSWHAALHELMQGDVDAVRRRYERELAPPLVSGSRALVDSGALLWRCHVNGAWEGALPSEAVCGSAPDGWLISPPTPFAALHSALSLAAEGDEIGLAALRTTSLAHADPVFREVVAPVCRALQAMVERDYDARRHPARGDPAPRRRARRQRRPARRARGHPRARAPAVGTGQPRRRRARPSAWADATPPSTCASVRPATSAYVA